MIPLVKPYIAPEEEMMPAIKQILYSGYIAEGQAVYDFEEQLGKYLDNENILSMNSGTAAIHIALLLIGIKPGDEVISTAMTAEPTNTTIALTGAKIVWGDVDPNTGLLSPEDVRKKITDKTKAIMLVHYAGMVCDMDEFNKISMEYNIPIIEDTAHAFGSKYASKRVGSNSEYTCFSFQAIKHMTTVDGGCLALKTNEKIEKARKLRWFGLDKKVNRLNNNIEYPGYKYGMNNVNATIGMIQLKHMDEIIGKHVENGKFFDSSLNGIDGIKTITYASNTEPSYWLYTMLVDNREEFCKMMEDAGISASPLHLRNDRHSVFSESKIDLPGLDKFYKNFVHIPCGWWVDEEKREFIVNTIKKGW